jgi:PAT family beta-lactamase induction signal transducer AmpG
VSDAASDPIAPSSRLGSIRRLQALYLLLGFSAGLPFFMFSTVLAVRLTDHGVALAVIGFFAWVQLLPTFKFLWAPLLDRYHVPGFARFWGKRRGWIMLSQLGIVASLIAMAAMSSDASLPLTALLAVSLAFWTTTLEVAADAWRIELAPTRELQAPLAAANLWGYRTAMVAAGSGALLLADRSGWTAAYLLIAAAAAVPLPILAALPAEQPRDGGRAAALGAGVGASTVILAAVTALFALVGSALLSGADGLGIDSKANVTPWVLGVAMLPFLAMAAALPRIRRASSQSRLRTSVAIGPYVDFFWRYGGLAIALMAFVSIYRMGDVLALNLSKPMILGLGYTKSEIGWADGAVALIASIVGVGLGSWMAARWRFATTLSIGALFAGIGNFGFVWLAHQPRDQGLLYLATAADQFGNGMAGAIFVVYLSLLVNPRHAGAQYAFLSGFAFLLPRLLSGAGGTVVERLDARGLPGFDLFFLASGAISLAAMLFIPLVARARAREDDAP